MSRTEFKKVVRTKTTGQCKCGGGFTWTERVRSNKAANKTYRKANKEG